MSNVRLLARAGIGATALAIVAAACGGGGGGSNSSKSSSSNSQSGSAAGAYTVYQPSDKRGGTLNLLDTSDCDYWDPQRTYYGHCWDLQRLISRGLLMYKPAPGNEGTQLVPDLAKEVPTSPDGGITWTYHLKDNIKFEDGTPIKAQDIKYGIERVFATDVINGGPTYVIDELQGGDSYKGPYKDKNGLASIQTPDDKTITFKLKRKFSDWNYVMASPTSVPVPQAKDKGDAYTNHPVASGPYKFENYQPNKSLTLVRNDAWDRSTDPYRKALPDKIVLTMGLEANDVDNRIIANQADSDVYQTGLQTASTAKVNRDPALKARTVNVVQPTLRYLAVFTKNAPFDNVHCRKAVALIVDKKGQQLARGGTNGGGQIATTMLPPTLNFYQNFNLYPQAGETGNVEAAKNELKLCGKPNGFNTKIATRNKGKEVPQATALQADLKKIGINASIQQYDASQYFSAVIGIPDNVHKQGFGMAFAAWGPDWPAPYGFLHFIVDGREILPQGNSNYAELNEPAVNNGIDSALAATSKSEQQADWTKVDKAIVDSAAYIPLLNDKVYLIHSARVTNVYVTNAYNGAFDFVSMGVMP
jgi:peptide/nickel transport system substrate-binding protein